MVCLGAGWCVECMIRRALAGLRLLGQPCMDMDLAAAVVG